MAANIAFQPLAKFGLLSSMRSRLRSFPPRRARMAFTRSGGPAFSSEIYGNPDFDVAFGWSARAAAASKVDPKRTAIPILASEGLISPLLHRGGFHGKSRTGRARDRRELGHRKGRGA